MKAFRMVSSVSVPMHRGHEHLGACSFCRGHSWAPELGTLRQWGQRPPPAGRQEVGLGLSAKLSCRGVVREMWGPQM